MPLGAYLNEGPIPYGSRIITLKNRSGTIVGTYVADNITVNRPSTVISRMNEVGEPSGQVLITDFETGNATFQLATTSSTVPEVGYTFSSSFTQTLEYFVLNQIDHSEVSNVDKKVNVNFRKLYVNTP